MARGDRIDLTRTKRASPAPDPAYIRELREEANQQAGPARQRWERIRQVRERKHAISIPDAYKTNIEPIRTHFVGDILRTVKASLTSNFPTFSVPPAGPSPARQDNSTIREKWSNSVLQNLNVARPPKQPWLRVMDHAVSLGLGVNKLVYTPRSWFDMPTAQQMFRKSVVDLAEDEHRSLDARRQEYKQGKLPFSWRAVDPRTWWGFYSDGQLIECVETTERTVQEITSRYAVAFDGERIRPEAVSEAYVREHTPASLRATRPFTEHWTPEWVTYTCDDVVLQAWRHGYGRTPYFPFYGLSNETADPGQEMESIVEHILDLVVAYDQLLTIWQNWAYLSGFPSGKITADRDAGAFVLPEVVGQAQQGPPDIRFRPGEWTVIPQGWDRTFDVPPPVGQDIIRVSDNLRQFIDRTIPDVLRGIGQSGESGYRINQLITAARLVYDPITGNAGLSLAEMMKFVWWLVENVVRERVYVWAYDAV